MLRERVITALVLFAVLAITLTLPGPIPFALLSGAFLSCAMWEWLRLTWGPAKPGTVFVPGVVAALALACIFLAIQFSGADAFDLVPATFGLWIASSVVWVGAILPMLTRARADAAPRNAIWSAFSWVALIATWTALNVAYTLGPLFLLSLAAVVWVADIAAYFVGKKFGRRKLAPHISPGKTIEGAIGGVVAAVALILISAQFKDTFGAALSHKWGMLGAACFGLLLAALSIAGDLFESLLKRRAGMKDSSGLLPGHGGVFDRLDALLPVLPLALLLV
ncbi:phosphatidate cytidylyltransferase [Pigmentiphaga aceris]|uniref:Phosphatidate cytidylyltransferase n=1 Tax=Pigmentiphaga aceris TaxID=1940612 RepID=A0A5C0AWW9_9BURK|nr:phosphatidate cytidylyltransferase [Pigmentiphaga aceris]QEI06266.1 phosphatidate cytidylyltransferase [Pigmentiphaga aceris]